MDGLEEEKVFYILKITLNKILLDEDFILCNFLIGFLKMMTLSILLGVDHILILNFKDFLKD